MPITCHLSILAVVAILLPGLTQTPTLADELSSEIPTWTKTGILKGASSTEEKCIRKDRVWVTDRAEGFCIRYFKNNIKPQSGTAVVIFDGDYVTSFWDANGMPIRPIYVLDFGGKALLKRTANHTKKSKNNMLIFVARPGQLGSSGDHKQKFKRFESRVVNSALDQIKERYKLNNFVLVGHSGGALLVANLLAKRSDIKCAVMNSGAVALHEFAQDRGFNSVIWATWEDPISSIDGIKPASTEYYVIAGDGDNLRPPKYQKMFADALREKGANVHYLLVRKPKDPHNLQDEAIKVADLCASGIDFAEIKKGLRLTKSNVLSTSPSPPASTVSTEATGTQSAAAKAAAASQRATPASHASSSEVCHQAVDLHSRQWKMAYSARDWLHEAERRKLVITDCLAMLGRPVEEASNTAACEQSLDSSQRFFDPGNEKDAWVAEVRKRKLTADDCRDILGLNTLQTPHATDIEVCERALDKEGASWIAGSGSEVWSQEAEKRRLTSDACKALLGSVGRVPLSATSTQQRK